MADGFDVANVGNSQSIRSVLNASRMLRENLDADVDTLEFYTTGLERAADVSQKNNSANQSFMFSSPDSAEDNLSRGLIAQDTLASILADLQVANVLMAAGQAKNEANMSGDPALLDQAIQKLDETANGGKGAPAPERLGFAEEAPSPVPQFQPSASIEEARENYHKAAGEALDTLIAEAKAVLTHLVNAASKIDNAKLLEALGKLSEQFSELPKAGRLFKQGLEKAEQAIDALIRLLGSDILKKIEDQVCAFWSKLQEGEYFETTLNWAYKTGETSAFVDQYLEKHSDLLIEKLDAARQNLALLSGEFKENLKTVDSLIAAVSLAGTILIPASLVVPALSAPQVTLFFAAGYGLIAAYILLAGMDYTDSEKLFKRVQGVRSITLATSASI